jgi:hypothetical protein
MTKKDLIDHILWMRSMDEDYAREALINYHAELPWLDLMNGVRQALEQQ